MINWNFSLDRMPIEEDFLILTKKEKVYHVSQVYETPSYEETFQKFLYLECIDDYIELEYDEILCWSQLNFPKTCL